MCSASLAESSSLRASGDAKGSSLDSSPFFSFPGGEPQIVKSSTAGRSDSKGGSSSSSADKVDLLPPGYASAEEKHRTGDTSKESTFGHKIAALEEEVSRLKDANAELQKQVDKNNSSSELGLPQTLHLAADAEIDLGPKDTRVVQFSAEDDEMRGDSKNSLREGSKDRSSLNTLVVDNRRTIDMQGDVFAMANDGEAKRQSSQDKIAGYPRGVQLMIYFVAVAGVAFVLIAKSTDLGKDDSGHGSSSSSSSGSHRRLGGGAPPLLERIAFAMCSIGIITFFVNMLNQPLILGYLLGGVLVGPVCLDIVHGVAEIQDFSSLGLVFLLFMVGLELDVKQLLSMGKVVLVTGFLQFPLCVGVHLCSFMALNSLGVSFGELDKSVFYVALVCGISSTMIVAKSLAAQADMDSPSGRLTIGILIFQDIWAIIVLAVQPDLANPQPVKLVKLFALVILLIAVAVMYATFVMPFVFNSASGNVELMLVMALSWCFFMCCFAILPFIGLSMELAALIAGVAVATFPYVAEFNGKVKYVRDFFITIFFCGLGMQIPAPEPEPILTALLIAVLVLLIRWLGIFSLVMILGGGSRLAAVATINLSEVSEFALVICSLGITFDHIGKDTLTIMIWVFALLAIMSANLLPFNYKIYALLVGLADKCRGRKFQDAFQHENEDHEHEDKGIVILGFHKVAAMLIHQLKLDAPQILHKIHVVDFNEKTLAKLSSKGISTAYGDVSCPDVLEHAVHGEAKLVLLTIPDALLRGTSNMKLLKVAKTVWPECKCITNADSPSDVDKLYAAGADYVLRMSNLCADKLCELLEEFSGIHHEGHESHQLSEVHDFLKNMSQKEDGAAKMKQGRVSVLNFR